MRLDTERAKQLDVYIHNNLGQKVADLKVTVELKGNLQRLDVYRFPIKFLLYNLRNGRFAAELLAKEEETKRKLDPSVPADAKIIQEILLTQSESETTALKDDLKLHGQIEPGIITNDGAVINANRRMAILWALYEETREPRFEYLMAGRLEPNVDEKDLWRIEAGLQFAKDFRLEYGPINELLKLKEGIDRKLTPADISKSLLGRYDEKGVNEKLEILKLIDSYLKMFGRPREYHRLQKERSVEKFNSLQANVIAPLKRKGVEETEIAKVVSLAFVMIEKTDLSHWDIRALRRIALEKDAKEELFRVYDPKKLPELKEEELNEAYSAANEIVEDRKEKDRPERLAKKALSAIQSIDPKNKKLKEESVRGLLKKLLDEVSKLLKKA